MNLGSTQADEDLELCFSFCLRIPGFDSRRETFADFDGVTQGQEKEFESMDADFHTPVLMFSVSMLV